MATKVSWRDGGKTSEEGVARLFSKHFNRDGVIGSTDLTVTENSPQAANVLVSTGDIQIGNNSPYASTLPSYFYHGWVTAAEVVTITANTSGNARIDAIVAYIDLAVISSASNDNPGVLKCVAVAGTPAATPAAPTDATIQAAVGASNPWVLLAHVAVANGFSTIANANITDKRPLADTIGRIIDTVVSDFVETGLVWSQTSGLIGGMTAGRALIAGRYVHKPALSKTFTASKDTYIDLPKTAYPTATDDLTYTEVANNADAPALAAGSIRLAKVVTSGAAITSVVTSGVDDDGLPIRNTDPFLENKFADDGWTKVLNVSPSYTSATRMALDVDLTGTLQKGDKVRWTQAGSVKFGIIVATNAAYIDIFAGTDYAVTNAQVYDLRFSRRSDPYGFPANFNYTPVVTYSGGTTDPGAPDYNLGKAWFDGRRVTQAMWLRKSSAQAGANRTAAVITTVVPFDLTGNADFRYHGAGKSYNGATPTNQGCDLYTGVAGIYLPVSMAAGAAFELWASIDYTF